MKKIHVTKKDMYREEQERKGLWIKEERGNKISKGGREG
jgi:hypothetical protein